MLASNLSRVVMPPKSLPSTKASTAITLAPTARAAWPRITVDRPWWLPISSTVAPGSRRSTDSHSSRPWPLVSQPGTSATDSQTWSKSTDTCLPESQLWSGHHSPSIRTMLTNGRTVSGAFQRRLAALPRNPAAWVMLGLTVLSFVQRPGRTTFDTKLDLAVDLIAFLGRALHLWNPEATGGELQNQAYGYLFPMGPFFAAGQLLHIPPWLTERIWCALLLCLAFGGMLALTRALRIGSEPARFVGSLGYALAPRMLTEIGSLSAEMLP